MGIPCFPAGICHPTIRNLDSYLTLSNYKFSYFSLYTHQHIQSTTLSLQEIPPQQYQFEEGIIRINTLHFTKFVLVDTDPAVEITDALLTLAAYQYQSHKNAYIQLRLMMHSHCAGLHDFSAARMQVRL